MSATAIRFFFLLKKKVSLFRVRYLFVESSGADIYSNQLKNLCFLVSSQLCLHVELEKMCLCQFYASGSCHKEEGVVLLLGY